jgi:hypothetical protein
VHETAQLRRAAGLFLNWRGQKPGGWGIFSMRVAHLSLTSREFELPLR